MEKEILEKLKTIERNSLLAAKNVLTFDDVALVTGLSKSYLYKLTCIGEIPHYKPTGKQLFFDRAEIESWLKQNRIDNRQHEIDRNETTNAVTEKE